MFGNGLAVTAQTDRISTSELGSDGTAGSTLAQP
jgi:hypothetical protein